ncbi:MAG TPA: trehalose-phosphatase [Phycisphaerales bacterium]|nr:trehalose-phosphatase [Phycisphaerales bacterium]
MTPESELHAACSRLAATQRLLVAADFDGTLSPMVAVPEEARMLDAAARSLQTLAGCPATTVAVISGRDLASLTAVCPPMSKVTLIGSYGAQWEGISQPLSAAEKNILEELASRLDMIARRLPGAFVERKACSIAINVRIVQPPEARARALDDAHQAVASTPGLTRHLGKGVVEWSIRPTRKGDALESLRREHGATMTVALGDDEPDLEAFDRLDRADVRVFVSSSDVPGVLTIPTPAKVAAWLERLAIERADWTWLHPPRE